MLPLRLRQIKKRLETRKSSSILSEEEVKLLQVIDFLEENEEIQIQILSSGRTNPINEIAEPATDRHKSSNRLPAGQAGKSNHTPGH